MKKIISLAHIALIVLLAFPFAVFAHERQAFEIGNKTYLFVVGSLNEPIVVDDKTGVELRVKIADPRNIADSNASGAKPVPGLEQTLKVEISAGDKKRVMDLSPAYNDPGAYRAPFYPTVQTTYTYRFYGTIDETPVDVSFACNPAGHPASEEDRGRKQISSDVTRVLKVGSFGCPTGKAELGFPEPSSDINSLIGSIRAVGTDTSTGSQTQAVALAAIIIAATAFIVGSRRSRGN